MSVEDHHLVHLVEDLCNTAECTTSKNVAIDEFYPVDTEHTDTTFDAGVGRESFSGLPYIFLLHLKSSLIVPGEAAGYVQSSGSSIYLKTSVLFITSLYCTL